MIPLHFTLFITFLTLFLKLLGLQERVPKTSAGSWFQSWMVLFTKDKYRTKVYTSVSGALFILSQPTNMSYREKSLMYLDRS
jgi:hypothetical protein